MKFKKSYDAFVMLETGEYDSDAGDIRREVANLFEKFSIKLGLFIPIKNKPFSFINSVGGESIYVHNTTRGYDSLNDYELVYATVAKTAKGLRATSCGIIDSMNEYYKFLDKYSPRDAAEKIVAVKNAEIDEEETRWKKFQKEQAAKKAAAIARANELSGGYREVVTYQRSTYGGAFSATYYVERKDMTLDEFKEFITCLGHKAEAKPCDIPIKPEQVTIKQTSSTSWSYEWTGEWDD